MRPTGETVSGSNLGKRVPDASSGRRGLNGKVTGWQAEWMRGGVGALDLQVALLTRKTASRLAGTAQG